MTKLMELDGIEHRYHVRELDNRVAVILSKPGWACSPGPRNDYWYVSIEDLTPNRGWQHRSGSTVSGCTHTEALILAQKTYDSLVAGRR